MTTTMSEYCAVVYYFECPHIVPDGGTIVLLNTDEFIENSRVYWTAKRGNVFSRESGKWWAWPMLRYTGLWQRLMYEWSHPSTCLQTRCYTKIVEALSCGNEVTVGYLFEHGSGMDYYCRSQNALPIDRWWHYFYPDVTTVHRWLVSHMVPQLHGFADAPACIPYLSQELLPRHWRESGEEPIA